MQKNEFLECGPEQNKKGKKSFVISVKTPSRMFITYDFQMLFACSDQCRKEYAKQCF